MTGFAFIFGVVASVVAILLYMRNQELVEKYGPVKKAKKRAAEIMKEAKTASEEAEGMKLSANNLLVEADEIMAKATQMEELAKQKTEQAEARANQMYQYIVANENIAKGYGDKYLIPSNALLDSLADEYSFAQAGQDLKNARTITKDLVKKGKVISGLTGNKDFKKAVSAIAMDAFNGRADSILASVKHDNFGTLNQKLLDAFALVNQKLHAAFNAEITSQYLNARANELRCACIAMELREKDKEEQRELREKMREEAKAIREQEKAIRESEQQEAALRDAMEKAQAQFNAASEEQKAKFTEELEALKAKLADAEAKGQRAKSMAEITRAGYIYIISNIGSFGDDVLKIGMTRRLDPMDRVHELGDASVPFPFDVHAMIYSKDAPTLEKALHHKFNAARLNKVNFRKEFFRIGIAEVKKEINDLGLSANFTIQAEARQYHESIAIDKMNQQERDKILSKLLEEEDNEAYDVMADAIEV